LKKIKTLKWACLLVVAALAASSYVAGADKLYGPGVTDSEIKIGQTMPYNGPVSAWATLGRAQAVYVKMLNEQGGIGGRHIELVSLDDGYSPPKTVVQRRRLVEQENVLFLFSSFVTPTNTAIHKYVNAKRVPHLLVASIGSKWADPQHFPWTVALLQDQGTEAAAHAAW
jgi:branched-chain amino acid transport system substrate-binding protein